MQELLKTFLRLWKLGRVIPGRSPCANPSRRHCGGGSRGEAQLQHLTATFISYLLARLTACPWTLPSPHCMTRPHIAVPPLQQLSTSTSQCAALGGRAALASPFLPPSLAFTPCTPGSTCSFVDCNAERQHFLAKFWVLPSLSLQVMCTLLHVALLVSSLSY